MTKYERHPAPEKLLQQVTTEVINILALGGLEKAHEAALPEAGVPLIAKAWDLPQEILLENTRLIQKEKELLASGSSEASLPDEKLLDPYDGRMTAELVWGLFETAVRLEDTGDRSTIYRLALMMADILDFDEWIKTCGPQSTDR